MANGDRLYVVANLQNRRLGPIRRKPPDHEFSRFLIRRAARRDVAQASSCPKQKRLLDAGYPLPLRLNDARIASAIRHPESAVGRGDIPRHVQPELPDLLEPEPPESGSKADGHLSRWPAQDVERLEFRSAEVQRRRRNGAGPGIRFERVPYQIARDQRW